MNKKSATLTAVALCLALSVSAVPVKKGDKYVSQPDGTLLTIHAVGDEHLHFLLTDDNKLLTVDENGQYSYANIDNNGLLKTTGIKALNASARPLSHAKCVKDICDINAADIIEKRKAAKLHRAPAQSGLGTYTSNFPKTGKVKGLILLVQYNDVKFKSSYRVSAKKYFTDMINKQGFNEYGGTGCATEYFNSCSNNLFQPQFDIVGPITLSKNREYYGGNDNNGNDKNPGEMIVEACKLADTQINFADYDNDGDGTCDNVYVIYAGDGEATSIDVPESIWPHSWDIPSATGNSLYLDGVEISRYACSNEWISSSNQPVGVGTFIHEFSHVMGLPDLYSTIDSYAYYTPCDYSVMDYGPYNNEGRTPPTYSAFERNAMGWLDIKTLDNAENITLENIADSNQACIIQTSNSNEFFLLENRQQNGWDKYIPNHGMLIWHIDFDQTTWDNNSVNNNKLHQYVDIVEANNNSNGETFETRQGWTWPGATNKTIFSASSTPALKDWSGNDIDIPISNIAEDNGVISFSVKGGVEIDVPTPLNEDLIEKGDDYFIAEWEPVENAKDYKVWVYEVCSENISNGHVSNLTDESYTEVADMGSNSNSISLPDGWTSSSLGIYNYAASAGNAVPSAKMKQDDSWILTREFENYVTEISFWIKGMTTTSATMLKIEGKVGNSWETITSITPLIDRASTITLSDIPSGVTQVKFTYLKTSGSLAIDDISITTEAGVRDNVLPLYNGVLTGGATKLRICKLNNDCNYYKYTVAATPDEVGFSEKSEYSYISLTNSSSVKDIQPLNTDFNVTINGQFITVNTDQSKVEIFNTMGIHIATLNVCNGTAQFNANAAGLYIVRAGNKTAKIRVI